MKQIQTIYREEEKLKELSPEERLQRRQLVVKPLVDALFVYLKKTSGDISSKSKLGDAFGYMLNQEKYLRVFLTDGEVPIDNNASERFWRSCFHGQRRFLKISGNQNNK